MNTNRETTTMSAQTGTTYIQQKPLGQAPADAAWREHHVIGEVSYSGSGNLIIEVGHVLHILTASGRGVPAGWEKVAHLVLSPEERDELLTRITAPVPPVRARYLVWSLEWRQWWKADGSGYTSDLWQAGRFNEADAVAACGFRSWTPAPNGDMQVPPEVMILAPDQTDEDVFTIAQVRALGDLMIQRIAMATGWAMQLDRQGLRVWPDAAMPASVPS